MATTFVSQGLKLNGWFDPDFDPINVNDTSRDDEMEAHDIGVFYFVMGETDGRTGNASRAGGIPSPLNKPYKEGYNYGSWFRLVMTQF